MNHIKLTAIQSGAIRLGAIAHHALWAGSALVIGSAIPAIAHNVEIANDIAVTMHIEPNHNPKAGEPTLAWFALTRRGGQLVPAGQCACQLSVYREPYKTGTSPILQQTLTGINAEQSQNIPGSTITFPRAGQYILEMTGKPKGEGSFAPFAVRYTVTVTGGPVAASPNPVKQASPTPATTQPTGSPKSQATLLPVLLTGLGIAAAAGLVVRWVIRQKKREHP